MIGLKNKIAILLGALFFCAIQQTVSAEESCYELNQRYGRCVQASLKGEPCRSGDDFVMPERCRGGGSADQGLRDGVFENQTDEDQILNEWLQENQQDN